MPTVQEAAGSTAYILNQTGSIISANGSNLASFSQPQCECGFYLDMARDTAGNFIMAGSGGNSLVKIGTGATVILTIPPPANSGGSFRSVAIDASGYYIVADNALHQIWRIAPDGTSPTAVAAYPVSNGAASEDVYVRVDASGNYIIIEDNNSTLSLHKMTPGGVVTSIAISGSTLPTSVSGMTLDASGNYISVDYESRTIFTITPAGVVTALFTDANGYLAYPSGISRDLRSGQFYLVDNANGGLFTFNPDGSNFSQVQLNGEVSSAYPSAVVVVDTVPQNVTYYALEDDSSVYPIPGGTSIPCGLGCTSESGVSDFAFNSSGDFVVAAYNTLVDLTQAGVSSVIATAPTSPVASQWVSVAVDSLGNYIVADNQLHQLVSVSPTGTITPIATYCSCSQTGEQVFVRIDAAGNYIVAEDNGGQVAIFRITPAGVVTPIALTGAIPYAVGGLTLDSGGNYVLTDFYTDNIDSVTPAGVITTLYSNMSETLYYPRGIYRDPASGNFLIADQEQNALFSLSPDGTTITLVAGQITGPVAAISSAGIPLASQIITFNALSNQVFGTPPFTVGATATSGLTVSFASTTLPVCTVSGGTTVTMVAGGTCTIQATQAGNANYAAATPVNQSFTVNQAGQTISFATLSNQVFGTPPFTVGATATSGLTVSFASTTLPVCTVSGGTTVTMVAGGTCTIQATQAGNGSYAAATPVNQSFSVSSALIITTSSLPGAAVNESWSTTLAASGGTPGYTWSATGLPSWLTLAPATGILSGFPTASGTYTFNVTATDTLNGTNTILLSLPVTLPLSYLTVNNPSGGLAFVSGNGANVSPIALSVNGYDVAQDAGLNVVVAAGTSLQRVTPSGVVSTIATALSPASWVAVAVDPAGNFIVGDNYNHAIWRVTPDGTGVSLLSGYGAANTAIHEHVRILVDVHGNYIVAEDNTFNGGVVLFSLTPGNVLTTITQSGAVLPLGVGGLTFDANGNYMLLDSIRDYLFQITPQGVAKIFGTGVSQSGLALARNPLTQEYVAGSSYALNDISANGATVTALASSQSYLAGVQGITAITDDFPSTVDATNPLAYFRLETASGVSENGSYIYSLAAAGAAVATTGAAPIGTPSNNFASLDGNAGEVTTSLSGGIATAGSMMAWVNLAGPPSGQLNYVAGESALSNDFDLQFDSNNVLGFYTTANGSSLSYTPNPNTLTGQWHMIVVTFDATAGTRAIYWDGALVANDNCPSCSSYTNKTGTFWIGNTSLYGTFGNRYFNGGIDEVAVWNYALTAPQVYGMFASRPSGAGGTVSSVSPSSAPVNSGATPVTITGANFAQGATVWWTSQGGASTVLTPTSVSQTQIVVSVPPGQLTTGGAAEVSVVNPQGVPSNALPFTIQNPALTISPSTTSLSSASQYLPYIQILTASGGSGNYSWSIASQDTGLNLALSGATGATTSLTGTPTLPSGGAGFNITITLTDSVTNLAVQQAYTIPVTPGPPGAPITWTLSNALFSDGGAVTGSFTLASDLVTVSNWNVVTTTGTVLAAFTYTPANSTAYFVLTPSPALTLISNQQFSNGLQAPNNYSENRKLNLTFDAPWASSGGTVNLFVDNTNDTASHECLDCNPYRLVTQGSVTSALPLFTTTYILENNFNIVPSAGGKTVACLPAICATGSGNDIAVDASGNFIVATASALAKVTPASVSTIISTAPQGSQWISVAVDQAGYFIVADNVLHRIVRISPAGTIVPVASYSVLNSNELEDVYVRIDGSGNYIVADDNGGAVSVFQISTAGTVTPITITGTIPASIAGLTLDGSGNYVVSDYSGAVVDVITPAGVGSVLFSNPNRTLSQPFGIYYDPASGNFLIADHGAGTLYSLNTFGTQLTQVATGFTGATSVVIAATNSPIITTSALPAGVQNQQYTSTTMVATGGSGNYTWSATGLPQGLAMSTAGVINGTPSNAFVFSVVVTVTDATTTLTATKTYQLTIASPPSPPPPSAPPVSITSSTGSISTIAGGSVSATFTASGGAGSYRFSASGLPAGVSVGSSGSLGGSPTQAGSFNVTVTVTDGQNATASTSISINVLGLNSSALPAGAAGKVYVASIGAIGGAGAYSFTATGLPAGLSMSGSGSISGTPSTAGTYPFNVTVSSGGLNVSGSFSITITKSQPLTISGASLPDGTVNVHYSQALSATGGSQPYTWSLISGAPPQGLSMGSSGIVAGIPVTPGAISFGVQVTDNAGAIVTATASVGINPTPLIITTQSLPSGMNGVDYPPQLLTAGGGVAPYTWKLTSGSLPLNMSFSSGGVLSGVPGTAVSGAVGFTVTDSAVPTPVTNTANLGLTIRPTSPDLILTSGALGFSLLSPAAAPPPSGTVGVVSTVGKQVIGYSVSVNPAASWLSVNSGTATPDVIQVSITPSALTLPAGDYSATITATCTSTGCAGHTQSVSVNLNVTATPPKLNVETSLLPFATSLASTGPLSQQIEIENAGGGSIGFASVSCEAAWCTVGGVPGSLAGGITTGITVTVDPGVLKPGFYRTQVDIGTSAGAASVPVTLFIAPNSTMTLAPQGTQFNMPAGSSPGNPNGSFLVSVNNATPVNWTAAEPPGTNWLVLGTPSGTSSSTAPGTVSYSIDPAAAGDLSPGAYYGRIEVTSADVTNSPQEFEVVLNVALKNTPVTPDPEPGGLLFITAVGGVLPPRTVTVYSGSVTPSAFQTSATTSNGGNWLQVSPDTGSAADGSPGVTTVSINTTGLKAGVYEGGVTYSLSASAVRTVNVTLIVTGSAGPTTSSEPPQPSLSGLPRVGSPHDAGCAPTVLAPTQTGLVNNFSAPASWPTPLAIQLSNDCGLGVNNGQIVATFSNGDPPLVLPLADPTQGIYEGTWSPRKSNAQVSITIRASAPGYPNATSLIAGAVVPNAAPILTPNSTLHSFDPSVGAALAPGTIVAIYGQYLASATVQPVSIPLPTTLNGTSVIIGGTQAPLYYVSPGQINAQIPFELVPGNQYQVIVSANGALTTPDTIQLSNASPGLAAFNDGTLIAQHGDGTLVSPTSPAQAGEILVSYLAGMGGTTANLASGDASPTSPLASPIDTPALIIDGTQYPTLFVGLTPGLVGLYQMNFQAPAGLPAGDLTVSIVQDGQSSNQTVLPYQP